MAGQRPVAPLLPWRKVEPSSRTQRLLFSSTSPSCPARELQMPQQPHAPHCPQLWGTELETLGAQIRASFPLESRRNGGRGQRQPIGGPVGGISLRTSRNL